MDVDVYILIGGRSSRFGSHKAFVELDGEMLATGAARVAKTALAPRRLSYIAATAEQFDPDLLTRLKYPLISDVKPGFGAWSALHAALVDGDSEWVFVLACDLPFISIEFVRLLSNFATGDLEAAVPIQHDGQLQPLCAFYRRMHALSAVERAFSGHHLPRLQTVFSQLETKIVQPIEYEELQNSERFFININTNADLVTAAGKES